MSPACRMKISRAKLAVSTYLAAMVMVHGALLWQTRESIRNGYPDFTIYYCAGTMVRTGLGHQLYESRVQYQTQQAFAPNVATRLDALPYNHPPFEALIFVPFSYLPYLPAFILWDTLNVAMLIAIPLLVQGQVASLRAYSWPQWMLASLAFFPIFFTLLQGQDSVLLLLLYTLAFVCLKKNSEAMAGTWLAVGLFKPHLVLPFVFLWTMRSRRILYGFLPTAAVLTLISLAVVGVSQLMSYPRYVWRLERTMASGAIMPSDMPNLRGVMYILFLGSPDSVVLTIALSLGLLMFAAWQCWAAASSDLLEWKFSLATVVTVAVGYHCLGYDLSILLLPIALVAASLWSRGEVYGWPRTLILSALAILFLSPLQLFLLLRANRLALVGWAVLLLLSGVSGQVWMQMDHNRSRAAIS
jgi:hypothetical protein